MVERVIHCKTSSHDFPVWSEAEEQLEDFFTIHSI
jgi:hypothetical protein